MSHHEFTAGFFFCGLGAGALGFLDALGRLAQDTGSFRSLGGIDLDPEACADFEMLTGSPATCADLGTMTPAELIARWGTRRPDAIFTSPPCKGFSGLLSTQKSLTPAYQSLNELVLKGLFLALETWSEPPPLIALENVPRIMTRGSELLRRMRALLSQYGYVFHEGTHDCGEIGGLAQHRRRYLMVARRPKVVTAYIYKPPLLTVQACGTVLETLPMPADPDAGTLHQLPKISWLNWVRLALIPAGGDWRDLPKAVEPAPDNPEKHWNKYRVTDWAEAAGAVTGADRLGSGAPAVADPRLFEMPPETFRGVMGVNGWDEPVGVVAGASRPSNGRFSVADPRIAVTHRANRFSNQLKVRGWDEPVGTVTGDHEIHAGAQSVADPRFALGSAGANAENFGGRPGMLGVLAWNEPSPTVTGRAQVSGGSMPASVADPRISCPVPEGAERRSLYARYDVRGWEQPARTVAGPGTSGGFAVADPMVRAALPDVPLGFTPRGNSRGPYGVIGWDEAAATITGSGQLDNGAFSVADPRDGLVIIRAADGTWHRPITTLEFAALQSIPTTVNGRPLKLAGRRQSSWRERIGNAVPRKAARAIGESLLQALIATACGGWALGSTGIWVRKRDSWAQEAQSTPYEVRAE
jgi:site-specific DNA-cytosine methylase